MEEKFGSKKKAGEEEEIKDVENKTVLHSKQVAPSLLGYSSQLYKNVCNCTWWLVSKRLNVYLNISELSLREIEQHSTEYSSHHIFGVIEK